MSIILLKRASCNVSIAIYIEKSTLRTDAMITFRPSKKPPRYVSFITRKQQSRKNEKI